MKIFFSIVMSCLWLSSCAVESPRVGPRFEKVQFLHASAADKACTSCHEGDRPAPFADTPHGGGKECSVCHASKDDRSGWLPRLAFNHEPKPAGCLDCHIKQRPAAPHPATGDCASCHNYPSFK